MSHAICMYVAVRVLNSCAFIAPGTCARGKAVGLSVHAVYMKTLGSANFNSLRTFYIINMHL